MEFREKAGYGGGRETERGRERERERAKVILCVTETLYTDLLTTLCTHIYVMII